MPEAVHVKLSPRQDVVCGTVDLRYRRGRQ